MIEEIISLIIIALTLSVAIMIAVIISQKYFKRFETILPELIKEGRSGRIFPRCECGHEIKYGQKYCDDCGRFVRWDE